MWKKLLLVLSFVVGIAAFCAIPFIVGVEPTRRAVADVGWLCAVGFVLSGVLVLFIPAVGWTILMRGEGLRIPFLDAFKANLMGFPLNFVTPSMYLGGEPLKVYYLAAKHGVQKRRILATIIVGKFQELAAIVLVSIAGTAVFLWRTEMFTRRSEVILIAVMVILVALLGLLCWAFIANWQPSVKLIQLIAKIGIARRRMARARSKAIEMEHLIHLAFTKRWKTFVLAQVVTVFSSLSVLVRPWIFFYFTKDRVLLGSEHVAMIYVVTNVLNMFTIIPGGLGIFEGGMVGYFELAGLGKHNAAAFGIVTRISDLFLVALGTWLIVHLGMSRIAKDVAKGRAKVSEAEIREAIESEEE